MPWWFFPVGSAETKQQATAATRTFGRSNFPKLSIIRFQANTTVREKLLREGRSASGIILAFVSPRRTERNIKNPRKQHDHEFKILTWQELFRYFLAGVQEKRPFLRNPLSPTHSPKGLFRMTAVCHSTFRLIAYKWRAQGVTF